VKNHVDGCVVDRRDVDRPRVSVSLDAARWISASQRGRECMGALIGQSAFVTAAIMLAGLVILTGVPT
jgi:hypothetical protein